MSKNFVEFGVVVQWKNCSARLCTEHPFTGGCNAMSPSNKKYGVSCTLFGCDFGQYFNNISCVGCPAGKFNDQYKYKKNEAESCKNCTIGKYASNSSTKTCKQCPSGTKNGKISGASNLHKACVSCEAGKYTDEPGKKTCQNCDVGKHGITVGASSEAVACKDCSSGRYSDKPGSTECTLCGYNKYGTTEGQNNSNAACVNCKDGLYNDEAGLNKPCYKVCQVGMYCSKGMVHPCPLGKYGNNKTLPDEERAFETIACNKCPISRFGVRTGQTNFLSGCATCPAGRFSTTAGLANTTGIAKDYCPEACPPSQYLGADMKCKPCLEGAFCPGSKFIMYLQIKSLYISVNLTINIVL